mgnify:CR=1 FL=1
MRRFLFAIIVLNLLFTCVRTFGQNNDIDNWSITPSGRIWSVAFFISSTVGTIFFAVDAIRRKYDQENTLAIALALFGVVSFGFTTVFYYLRWGRKPLHYEFHDSFCETCLASSSEYVGMLPLWTLNYVIGGRFVGESKNCSECGSTVRTHCFYIVGVPVFSAGSFCVVCPSTNQYLIRKTEFYWPHVLKILLMPLTIALFVWLISRMD